MGSNFENILFGNCDVKIAKQLLKIHKIRSESLFIAQTIDETETVLAIHAGLLKLRGLFFQKCIIVFFGEQKF